MSYIALSSICSIIKKNLSLPHFSDLRGMESVGFDIDRKRLHIGSKHGSRLLLSDLRYHLSRLPPPKYLAIMRACRVGHLRLRLVRIGLVRSIIW
jgi:hypothetical protein